MNRPALFVASILLLGCGTPFQLLIHNDLPQDAEITVRWFDDYGGKTNAMDSTVFVPQGRAEQASLWYGSHDERGVDFTWQDQRGGHKIHVPSKDFPERTYHAYLGPHGVRFAGRDRMDKLHEAFTGLAAPFWWGCVLTVVVPAMVLSIRCRRERCEQAR